MDANVLPEQSAELPVMPDPVKTLVKMLDRGDSHDKMYRELINSTMAHGIVDKRCFEGDDLRVLFHTMSRPLLRSVLLKTLGPDLYDRRFLCVREMKQLIELLQTYAQAVDAYQAHLEANEYGNSQYTAEEEEAIRAAMAIDDAESGTANYDSQESDLRVFVPIFASGSAAKKLKEGQDARMSQTIYEFIRVLQKRCLPNVDEEVFQMQSPLMVGNAGDINREASDHLPSLRQTPKIWGLLLSCLSVMKLEYEVQFATLFRAWEDDEQINHAEILGTILAGSLLFVDGCNAKQPGTRAVQGPVENRGFDKSKELVFAEQETQLNRAMERLKKADAELQKTKEEYRQVAADVLATIQKAEALLDFLQIPLWMILLWIEPIEEMSNASLKAAVWECGYVASSNWRSR
ncbi:hypothetical protein F5Y05DRAFT_420360 [Hypoxylon sp. FL0543]|nr:hypothetical protein F5Y05DRAFT_420360 [Hypoxylon sp. FL0543]